MAKSKFRGRNKAACEHWHDWSALTIGKTSLTAADQRSHFGEYRAYDQIDAAAEKRRARGITIPTAPRRKVPRPRTATIAHVDCPRPRPRLREET